MKLKINRDHQRMLTLANNLKIAEIKYLKTEIVLKQDVIIVNKDFDGVENFIAITTNGDSINESDFKYAKFDVLEKTLNDLNNRKISAKSINHFVYLLNIFLKSLVPKRRVWELRK
jgi:hypothetical protein